MSSLGQQINDLLRRLIDRRYIEIAGRVVDAINALMQSGEVAQRLDEFEAEAVRLAEAGEVLRPDAPVVVALTSSLSVALTASAGLMAGVAGALQESGGVAAGTVFREATLGGLGDDVLGVIGVQWRRVDPEAVAAVLGYTRNPAWAAQLEQYRTGALQSVVDVVVRGFAMGQNPRRTAADLRELVVGVPKYRAETMMRTLQLMSYRQAERVHAVANADILSHRVRVAVLDARTCMACVALHGTRLAVDEAVTDHHNGRCTSVGVVKGIMRTVQTGEAWFERLPTERQQAQMGAGAWAAWQAGAVRLGDFVHRYEDELYGEMIREASLKGILGDGARGYYRR